MNIPEWLKPGLYGAGAGAAALAIVGFSWGGWVTESSANKIAETQAQAAVVAMLAPICVEQFQHSSDPQDSLEQLIKTNSWERRSFIEDRGWATMPGSDTPFSGVANACASLLSNLKAN